eukprot:11048474-Alexandrium_andersonii.AAC.1
MTLSGTPLPLRAATLLATRRPSSLLLPLSSPSSEPPTTVNQRTLLLRSQLATAIGLRSLRRAALRALVV